MRQRGWVVGRFDARRRSALRGAMVRGACRLGILLATGCAPPPQAPTAPPPRISFAASVHDFGTIEQGSAIDHAFSLTNRGGVELTIDKMRSGCGCEATLDVERVVPPGASARVRVRCDTATSFGKQRRTVSIYSNDPVMPVAVVRLEGEVRAETTLAPSAFYVGRVHRGERVRRDGFVRWPASGAAIDLVAAAATPFRVEMALPAEGSDRGTFTLVINDDAPLGPITGQLQLRSATGRTLRTVPVHGEIAPDVSVTPAQVALRAANDQASPPAAAVLVLNHGVRALRITAAEWAAGTATVATLDQGRRYRVELTAAKPGVGGDSELLVRTDHPEQPLLRIPVVSRVP